MEIVYPVHWPHFYTATIQGWKQLLSTESFKNIIIESLTTMVQEKRVELNAFVLMDASSLYLAGTPGSFTAKYSGKLHEVYGTSNETKT